MERRDVWALALSAAAMGITVLVMMPEWERRLLWMKARTAAGRLLAGLASRTGHLAMEDELAGRDARYGYRFTERLMRARDRLK